MPFLKLDIWYVLPFRICTPAPPGVQLMMAVDVLSANVKDALPVRLVDSKSPLISATVFPDGLGAGAAAAGAVAGAGPSNTSISSSSNCHPVSDSSNSESMSRDVQVVLLTQHAAHRNTTPATTIAGDLIPSLQHLTSQCQSSSIHGLS